MCECVCVWRGGEGRGEESKDCVTGAVLDAPWEHDVSDGMVVAGAD